VIPIRPKRWIIPLQIIRNAFDEPQAMQVAWQGEVDKVMDDWELE
jgi:hypothetical protein